MEVRWSEEAESTFDTIYKFVEEQWGNSYAENLRIQTLKILSQIEKHPYSFKESEIENVRKAFIAKHTSLFYEVQSDSIILVFFWDNRQNPII